MRPLSESGHVARHDLQRQPLGDGRLAHAGLADEDRVVLGAADQHLHDALDLVVAPDHRVELALARQLGQVAAVFFQRPVLVLGPRVVHAVAAAYAQQGLVDLLLVDAELLEYADRIPAALAGDGDQQVLNADILVVEPVGLPHRRLQHLGHAGRGVDLYAADGRLGLVGDLGVVIQHVADTLLHGGHVDVHLLEYLGRQALLLFQQRQENMLDVPHGVAEAADKLLRRPQHLLGLLGKSFLSHILFIDGCVLGDQFIAVSEDKAAIRTLARGDLLP